MDDAPDIELPTAKPIPVSKFSRRGNKTTQLVNNAKAEFSVDGRHRWFEFELEYPLFIQSITVETEGYDDWNTVQFEFDDVSGNQYEMNAKNNQGNFSAEVGRVAKGFRFKPNINFTFLISQKINRVVVLGYSVDELTAFEDAIGSMDLREEQIDQKYNDIDQREQESQKLLETLNTKIDELQNQKSQIDTDIGQLKA